MCHSTTQCRTSKSEHKSVNIKSACFNQILRTSFTMALLETFFRRKVPATGDDCKNQTPPTLLSSLRSVLFVIGTVLIGFAAFCNSLTWHLERFWGASGDFWQAQWDTILDTLGDDPLTLWVHGSLGLMFFVYWFFGGIYTILDITNRPAVLRKYKIQPGTNEPVDTRELCKVIAQVLFNQIIVGVPLACVSYQFMEWRGYPPVRELPTFHWVLVEIAIHILCEEIGFYYSHRFNQCFGVLGVLDRIHGTDTQFRNSRAYQRHVMMLSLVPPREAFPDEVKYKSK
ncbi:fatty acid hydroxylase domain-containing protein 2 isoform X3 [Bombus fervidus]|uniref:fatty acid hydroxylase domain-containing protein 2 isoform X3 n=1 Tax=Bombus fervidus TaxID=203811 RepID=UPI003AB65961